jgi:hypothetical protein
MDFEFCLSLFAFPLVWQPPFGLLPAELLHLPVADDKEGIPSGLACRRA